MICHLGDVTSVSAATRWGRDAAAAAAAAAEATHLTEETHQNMFRFWSKKSCSYSSPTPPPPLAYPRHSGTEPAAQDPTAA